MKRSISLLFNLLLLALITAGVVFRFAWVNWNEGADLHPDEYGLTGTISALRVPSSWTEYFNTRISPLSPYQKYDLSGQVTQDGPDNRMRWGQWPITLIRLAAEASGNTGYSEIRLLGRFLSALADALSLLVLFLTGRKLYGYRAGLLAAALGALAVMQIQQSHFMTSDNFGVLFTMLCLYCTVQAGLPTRQPDAVGATSAFQTRTVWPWYALAGVFLGMAVASRINLAVLGGIILLAALLNYAAESDGFKQFRWQPAFRGAFNLLLAAVLALVIFRLVQPMSFRAQSGDTTLLTLHLNPDWTASMQVAQDESNGINAGPPGEQWTNRPILVFPFVNMVVWGLGLALGLTAWAGFAWAAWQTLRGREGWQAHLLPLAWVGGYFLFMGTRHVMSMRYFLPIYPFLCLFAAWALLEAFKKLSGTRLPWALARVLPALLTAIVLAGTLSWAVAFVRAVYGEENTRIQATRWIFQNIPAPFNLQIDTGRETENLPVAAPDLLVLGQNQNYIVSFSPKNSGIVTAISIPHLRSQDPEQPAARISVAITSDAEGQHPLAKTSVEVKPLRSNLRGEASQAQFPPVALTAGQTYYLAAEVEAGGVAIVQRVVVANESWDESLPVRLDGYDPFGQFYSGLTMEVRWPDDDNKRQMYRTNLLQAEYIILPSQRSIWSISRLPEQYAMTMDYYRALFSGSLGFQQVSLFQAPWRLGPLYVSDLAGSAAWGKSPDLPLFNSNLLAAEEAFTVYDHAPVWIFKKQSDFNLGAAMSELQ